MVGLNMVMKFHNFDIFYHVCYIFDMSSALAYRVESINGSSDRQAGRCYCCFRHTIHHTWFYIGRGQFRCNSLYCNHPSKHWRESPLFLLQKVINLWRTSRAFLIWQQKNLRSYPSKIKQANKWLFCLGWIKDWYLYLQQLQNTNRIVFIDTAVCASVPGWYKSLYRGNSVDKKNYSQQQTFCQGSCYENWK